MHETYLQHMLKQHHSSPNNFLSLLLQIWLNKTRLITEQLLFHTSRLQILSSVISNNRKPPKEIQSTIPIKNINIRTIINSNLLPNRYHFSRSRSRRYSGNMNNSNSNKSWYNSCNRKDKKERYISNNNPFNSSLIPIFIHNKIPTSTNTSRTLNRWRSPLWLNSRKLEIEGIIAWSKMLILAVGTINRKIIDMIPKGETWWGTY